MQHLISAITLAKDYGYPPVDNTNFSDLTKWGAKNPASTTTLPNSLIFPFFISMSSPIFSPAVNIAYGTGFLVNFDLTITGASDENNIRIQIYDTTHTPSPQLIYDRFLSGLVEGVNPISLAISSSGFAFNRVLISSTTSDGQFEFSNMEIVSADGDFGLLNTGDRIICYWDDVTDAIVVKREDNPGADLTVITRGPNLGQLIDDQFSNWHFVPAIGNARVNTAIKVSNYAFCSGNDKNEFRSTTSNPAFPYFESWIEQNSPYCVLNPDPDDPPIVCDIHFEGEPVILIFPPDQYATNGSFAVTAVSSHADISFPIKYSFDAPSYSGNIKSYQQGLTSNTTGIFTGKKQGTYSVYAYDQYNCVAVIQVKLLIDPSSYGPLYRQEFKDVQTLETSRMDINQSQYVGPIHEPISEGGAPVTLNKPSGDVNNKFAVLRETNAEISIIAETDLQFIGLFSQNDRQYIATYERPVGTELWRGFITPSIYTEPFISTPYPVKITATDALITLKDEPFVDNGGNNLTGRMSLITIIMICLNKLGLVLGVRSSINKYAAGFSTGANDDPLDQTYLNVDCFYDEDGTPEKCDTVLEAVLKPFGAEIIQSNGWWNIVEVDNKTQAYAFRTFDYTGINIVGGNGTYDPIISTVTPNSTPGVLFADQDAQLEIIPAYGKITISHVLKTKISLFGRSLDKNWQTSIANTTTGYITFFDEDQDDKQEIKNGKLVFVPRKNKYQGLSLNNNDITFGQYITISSDTFYFTTKNDAVKLSFDYQHLLSQAYDDVDEDDPIVPIKTVDPKWVKIKWTLFLQVGAVTYKYSERIGWNTFTTGFYVRNEIVINSFQREFKSFDRVIDLPSFTANQEVGIRLLFQIDSAYSEDFNTQAGLNAIPTGVLPVDTKVKGRISGTFRYFRLRIATTGDGSERAYIAAHPSATSIPEVDYTGMRIIPDDYGDPSNVVIWDEELIEGLTIPVERIDLKKVVVTVLPNKKDPVLLETIALVNNPKFKESLPVEIITGDHPSSIIQKEIYTNWFSNSLGIPTSGWARTGFSENTSIQQILMKNIVNQYSKPSWKLSGSFVDLIGWGFLNVIKSTTIPTSIALQDPDFKSAFPDPVYWQNIGLGNDWLFDNGYPIDVKVDFVGESADSKYGVPTTATNISAGVRVNVDVKITRTNTDLSNLRVDKLVIVLFRNGVVVQQVTAVDNIQYNSTWIKTIKFNAAVDADNIGFFIDNISGPGTATYQMIYFRVKGLSVVRYYGINSLTQNDRHNERTAELYQLIPALLSTDPDVDDTGGGETDPDPGTPGSGGGSYSGDYNNDYASDFDTILN